MPAQVNGVDYLKGHDRHDQSGASGRLPESEAMLGHRLLEQPDALGAHTVKVGDICFRPPGQILERGDPNAVQRPPRRLTDCGRQFVSWAGIQFII
jgi:hypothetical protein